MAACVLGVALVTGATGCVTPVGFAPGDIVGTWAREGENHSSTITIDGDGTWAGTDYLFDEPGEPPRTLRTVSGEWELGEAAGNGDGRIVFDLEFDGRSIGGDSWYVTRVEDDRLVIYYLLGDPDQGDYIDYFHEAD